MNVVQNWLIAETLVFYYILMQNADISAPKYTYSIGYRGHHSTNFNHHFCSH